MTNRIWSKWALCAVAGVATAFAGRALTAQEDVLVPGGPIGYSVQPLDLLYSPLQAANVWFAAVNDEGAADEAPKSEYWLGVQIAALPEVAKQQLGIEDGLAVEDVMPDSPAAKAEIKKFDILVKAGDTPLKEATDLIKSVDAAQGKELTITIVRGGKDRTIKVVAAKRPEKERADVRVVRPLDSDIKRLEEALESLKNKAGKDGIGMWFARPGVVPPRVEYKLGPPIPKDLSVQINKQGGQPTKIHVKSGDKEWDITEDNSGISLSGLPDDVRPHVQRLLAPVPGVLSAIPGSAGRVGGSRVLRVTPEGKVEGEMWIAPMPPVPPKPPVAPGASAAPAAPQARSFAYRAERGESSSDAKLDALINEVKQLRKEIDELRGKAK